MLGSELENKYIRDIVWPKHSLLVAVKSGGREIIPHGNTMLRAGDMLVLLTREKYSSEVHDEVWTLCQENLPGQMGAQ